MNVLGQRPDVSEFRKRYGWMAFFVLLCMLVLIGQLISLQIVRHKELRAIAHANVVHRVTLATSRGIIRDRNGAVLVASRESWNVFAIPARLDFERVWPKLADVLGLGPIERVKVEAHLKKVREEDKPKRQLLQAALKAATSDEERKKLRSDARFRIREVIVKEDVHRDIVATLDTRANELPAVNWVSVPVRWYPTKDLAFHTLGYVNEVNREDIEANPDGGMQAGDRIGRSGIEKAFEPFLRGYRGWKKVVWDAGGNRRTAKEDLALIDEPKEQLPVPGSDLRLTLDLELMQSIKRAFAGELAGAAVVVEVKTGRVLALFSKPSVDSNDFVTGLSKNQVEAILNPTQLRPLIDRALYEAFFPGSTMKPFTALTALGRKAITSTSSETCNHVLTLAKTRFRCEGFHGSVSLRRAIIQSCNIYFYQAGLKSKLDPIAATATEFGFGQRSGIGLNSESPGFVPTYGWYMQREGQFRTGLILHAAIGQNNTKVTPLQLAMAYAALSNGGLLYAPQVVRSIERNNQVEVDFPPRLRRKINIPPDHLGPIMDGLWGCVNDERGTAYRARSKKVEVAGKTGSAQVSPVSARSGFDQKFLWYLNQSHAWFAAFAPYKDPEIAIAVIVEHGGHGGHAAAPIAMRAIDDYFTKIKPAFEGNSRSAVGQNKPTQFLAPR